MKATLEELVKDSTQKSRDVIKKPSKTSILSVAIYPAVAAAIALGARLDNSEPGWRDLK